MPNPKGADAGKEWLIIKNDDTQNISLQGWIVDDGELGSAVDSDAFTIGNITVNAGGEVKILIPDGNFTMNNSGEEVIRLFNPNEELVDSVQYSKTKEDQAINFTEAGGGQVLGAMLPRTGIDLFYLFEALFKFWYSMMVKS
jgi:hypothetical protein